MRNNYFERRSARVGEGPEESFHIEGQKGGEGTASSKARSKVVHTLYRSNVKRYPSLKARETHKMIGMGKRATRGQTQ